MIARARTWRVVLLVTGVLVISCKKAPPPAAAIEEDPLQASIELQGLARLKAASAFSTRYEANLMGAKINGAMIHRAGSTRLEYVASSGDPVVQVAGDGICWQKVGRVVLPCIESTAAHTTRLSRLLEASWLWPLKERKDRKVKPEQVTLDGKSFLGLTVLEAGGATIGTLLFDPSTYLVVGLKMQTTLMGKTGLFVGTFSKFEKSCGVQMATKRDYTFEGEPFHSEKLGGALCKPVEEKLFARPAQVEHGFVELKHRTTSNLACTKLTGPYSGVGPALKRVVGHLGQNHLAPAGPAVLIHRKGPPDLKQPARFVTDVCFTVTKKAWVLPKSAWKGAFFLREASADEVFAAYGLGDHVKTSTDLPGRLIQEAKKRGRKRVGPLYQILYMLPDHFTPEQRVSEMHLIPN